MLGCMKVFLFIFLVSVVVPTTESIRDQSYYRLNYGVLLKHHQTIKVTHQIWRSTFRIHLLVFEMLFNSSMYTSDKLNMLDTCRPHLRLSNLK